jgi:MFS family permease
LDQALRGRCAARSHEEEVMVDAAIVTPRARRRGIDRQDRLVIGAASVGTAFEWYDFYLYGSLASFLTSHFFSGVNETTGYIFALLAFAAGFAVRPFGALVFGRLGDLWGSKNTFLITLLLMGLSTFGVGLLPSYARIGVLAPALLVLLRLVQGLALGGEYGGAATYVAEHAPDDRRGFHTGFIQTTATVGLLLSLAVTLLTRAVLGEATFKEWGWRVPFLVSLLLLAASLFIRLKLNESPAFLRMVSEGKASKQPLTDSFAKWKNLRLVLLALFGVTSGQAVVWYAGQFYALFFLEKTLKVDGVLADALLGLALLLGAPGFVFFGWLSDKIGRKPVLISGCLLAAFTFFPVFRSITAVSNPALASASTSSPVIVRADPKDCSFQFDPVGKTAFTSSCDLAKTYLTKSGVPYANEASASGSVASIRIGARRYDGLLLDQVLTPDRKSARQRWESGLAVELKNAGYPAAADSSKIRKPLLVALLLLLVLYAAMVYGPVAALLVELFPTNVRYTSMSLPYHVGNGWFGGFLPTTAFAMVAATGDIYYGLWYPVAIALLTAVIGFFFVPETKGVDLNAI